MRFKIERRLVNKYSGLRWCIVRIADNQIVVHRDHEHECRELLPVIEILEPPPPAPLTQKQIDARVGEPQGVLRKLIWRAARR